MIFSYSIHSTHGKKTTLHLFYTSELDKDQNSIINIQSAVEPTTQIAYSNVDEPPRDLSRDCVRIPSDQQDTLQLKRLFPTNELEIYYLLIRKEVVVHPIVMVNPRDCDCQSPIPSHPITLTPQSYRLTMPRSAAIIFNSDFR